MTVRTALGLINQALDEILAEQEGDFDADTRFASPGSSSAASSEGHYGEADVLARAKNTSVDGLVEAGVLGLARGQGAAARPRRAADGGIRSATAVRRSGRRPSTYAAASTRRRRRGGRAPAPARRRLRRAGARARLPPLLDLRAQGLGAGGAAYNALVVAWPEIARRVAGTPEAEAQQALEV